MPDEISTPTIVKIAEVSSYTPQSYEEHMCGVCI